jgi:phosphoribosylformylglycinamidine cyclo-ligase
VGTKLKVAEALGRFDSIGIDLVAMCADDVAVQGADPLLFLDYVGVGELEPAIAEAIVSGVAIGCRQAGCALVGGELAEHGPGHTLDLAGFCVGVVERTSIITGAAVSAGDAIVGLASDGLRCNGFSLARRVLLNVAGRRLDDEAWPGADRTLADELLRPSIIYSPAMAALRRHVDVHAFAHVTGGGLAANLSRVLPATVDALIGPASWPVPQIFGEIERLGPVDADEMSRVFNLGIGMVAVIGDADVPAAIDVLGGAGVPAYRIGRVTAGAGRVVPG